MDPTSYIGGYYHEALFSEVVFTMVVLASLRAGKQGANRGALVIGLVSLLLANYRTSIIAAVADCRDILFAHDPFALGAGTENLDRRHRDRMAIAAIPLVIPLLPDRYAMSHTSRTMRVSLLSSQNI